MLSSLRSKKIRQPMFKQPPSFLSLTTVILFATVFAACGDSEPTSERTRCDVAGVDEAIKEIETQLDFTLLLPSHLPDSTSPLPEATIHSREDVTLLFPPCVEAPSRINSEVIGPALTITETTQRTGLPEPGDSDPPTERIRVGETPALIQRGSSTDTSSIALSWQQAGLSVFVILTWKGDDASPPEITERMEAEALRAAESMIR